jgi:hypothetical protein
MLVFFFRTRVDRNLTAGPPKRFSQTGLKRISLYLHVHVGGDELRRLSCIQENMLGLPSDTRAARSTQVLFNSSNFSK